MQALLLRRNRIRRFLEPPATGFGQMPPDWQALVWYALGLISGLIVPLLAWR